MQYTQNCRTFFVLNFPWGEKKGFNVLGAFQAPCSILISGVATLTSAWTMGVPCPQPVGCMTQHWPTTSFPAWDSSFPQAVPKV